MGPNPKGLLFLYEEEPGTQTSTERSQQEDTRRKQASASPGERPRERPALLTRDLILPASRSVTSTLWCLSHLVCGLSYDGPSRLRHRATPVGKRPTSDPGAGKREGGWGWQVVVGSHFAEGASLALA